MSLNWNEKCRLLKNIFILKKDCVTFIHIFSCRLFWHFSTNWRADIFVGSRHLALSKLDVLEDWVWLFGRRRSSLPFKYLLDIIFCLSQIQDWQSYCIVLVLYNHHHDRYLLRIGDQSHEKHHNIDSRLIPLPMLHKVPNKISCCFL